MAHSIIRKISSSVHHNIHYTIMADEVTDSSNRFESGNAPPEFPESPKLHYRQLYFNLLDIVIACIKARFDQPGYSIYSKMESVLLKSCQQSRILRGAQHCEQVLQ